EGRARPGRSSRRRPWPGSRRRAGSPVPVVPLSRVGQEVRIEELLQRLLGPPEVESATCRCEREGSVESDADGPVPLAPGGAGEDLRATAPREEQRGRVHRNEPGATIARGASAE